MVNLAFNVIQPLRINKSSITQDATCQKPVGIQWWVCGSEKSCEFYAYCLPKFHKSLYFMTTDIRSFSGIYIYIGRDLGKPGLMTNFEFHFSTSTITNIFYDQNAKRIMSQTVLIIKLCSFF